MSVRTITAILRAVRGLLVVALPVVAFALVWGAREAQPSAAPKSAPEPTGRPSEAPRALSWYAPLWERDLRQPPIPPAPAPEPAQPNVSAETPRLVATFVDDRSRYAHLLDRDGRLQFKQVDDEIAGYRVAAIEPGRVELARGTRTLWIEVPKPNP